MGNVKKISRCNILVPFSFSLLALIFFGCTTYRVPIDNTPQVVLSPTLKQIAETKTLQPTITNTPTIVKESEPAAKLTETLTPTPSRKSRIIDPPVIIFSQDNANGVSPSDVLKEIGYHVGGAGDCECCNNYKEPAIDEFITTKTVELEHLIFVYVCGLRNNEYVEFTITKPSGEKKIISTRAMLAIGPAYAIYGAYASMFLGIDEEVGNYFVEIKGENVTLNQMIDVRLPDGPRLYWSEDKEMILLYNFVPNEKVRILKYDGNLIATLSAWIASEVDNNGQLYIKLDGDSDFVYNYKQIVIIGEKSGELKFYRNGFEGNILISSKNGCPGAPPTRLAIGHNARVTITNGQPVKLRNEPGLSGKFLLNLLEGEIFKVVDGPICKDGYNWWKIQTNKEIFGWAAEGNSKGYFLEPWQ